LSLSWDKFGWISSSVVGSPGSVVAAFHVAPLSFELVVYKSAWNAALPQFPHATFLLKTIHIVPLRSCTIEGSLSPKLVGLLVTCTSVVQAAPSVLVLYSIVFGPGGRSPDHAIHILPSSV